MITAHHLRAMRLSLSEKLATRTTDGRDLEEMSRPKWIQTAKDIPVVAIGAGLGYASGKMLSEVAARHLLRSSPTAQRRFLKASPYINTALTSVGAYTFGRQQEMLRQRRAEAEALARTNKSIKQAAIASRIPTQRIHSSFVRGTALKRSLVRDREKWDDSEDLAYRMGDEE